MMNPTIGGGGNDPLFERLRAKARWIWCETLRIHLRAPETRVASSLSPVEIFTCLYYGGILGFDPTNPRWAGRDRFIASKGHGSVSLYPILADLGFFPMAELQRVCRPGSFLGGIPDPIIPGYETVNGSLGHGPGVACGMAMALRKKKAQERVWVMVGDGEMHEGAVWEALLFAGHQRLNNLALIVDNNQRCMLNDTARVVGLEPLADKLRAFGWRVTECDGHDIREVWRNLNAIKTSGEGGPFALIANTVKGHGVPMLEASPISHVLSVPPAIIEQLLAGEHAAVS
jgi:transketolase